MLPPDLVPRCPHCREGLFRQPMAPGPPAGRDELFVVWPPTLVCEHCRRAVSFRFETAEWTLAERRR